MKQRQRTLRGLLGLLVFGFPLPLVYGQEAPSVMVRANSPGWITISWEHTGTGTAHYVLERQKPPLELVFVTNVNSYTDKNLQASTTYSYRVCAVDPNEKKTCSPWIAVTTMPPESSVSFSPPVITERQVAPDRIRISWRSTTRYSSFNVRWSEKGTPAGQENVKGNATSGSFEARDLQPGRTYAFLVQGCSTGLLGSSCSKFTGEEITTPFPRPPHPAAPAVSASAAASNQITLSWPIIQAEQIENTVIERDGRKHAEGAGTLSPYKDPVRPNTEYAYRVCVTNQTGTACSESITAMGQPIRPSSLVDVTFTQSKFSGIPGVGVSGDASKIYYSVKSTWRNVGIPGQFITLEREDRGPVDPIRVGTFWTEVNRVSAKTDPTEISIAVTNPSKVGIREGNIYRVCAVVPALGNTGKVCSTPSALTENQASDQIKKNVNFEDLATKGAIIANKDPLALELRNQQPEGLIRRGFDIGMAAAEGQTLPGPGKQEIQDSLGFAEQRGFMTAVSFSLERNRNGDLAAKGAAVAKADQAIADARNSQTDVFYKLGFDIATGIFGDPKLGAQGNTVAGPGSLGIRNALSPAGQRGFNDSMKLNLTRRNQPKE